MLTPAWKKKKRGSVVSKFAKKYRVRIFKGDNQTPTKDIEVRTVDGWAAIRYATRVRVVRRERAVVNSNDCLVYQLDSPRSKVLEKTKVVVDLLEDY